MNGNARRRARKQRAQRSVAAMFGLEPGAVLVSRHHRNGADVATFRLPDGGHVVRERPMLFGLGPVVLDRKAVLL